MAERNLRQHGPRVRFDVAILMDEKQTLNGAGLPVS